MSKNFKSNIRKIYAFRFLTSLHFIAGVLVPFFANWGGLSFAQIMILQSWFFIWVFILEVPTGTIADFYGRKQSLLLAAIIGGIAALIYGSTPNFYIFLLGEFLWAMSAALTSGADEAFTYDTLKKIGKSKESKKIFAKAESFGLAGIMVAAPIGSLMATYLGLQAPMLMIALPCILAYFIALSFKEPKTTKKVESERYTKILIGGMKYFHKSKVLKILAIDMVSIGGIAYFMIWFNQAMLIQAGVDIIWFGLIASGFVASQIILVNSFGWIEKILGSKKRIIFLSGIIVGLMFILGGITTYIPLVILAIFLGGGFGLARRPLFASYMNKHIPSNKRSTVLSSISMFQRFIVAIINPFVGLAVDWSLNYTMIGLGITAIIFSFISRVEEAHLID